MARKLLYIVVIFVVETVIYSRKPRFRAAVSGSLRDDILSMFVMHVTSDGRLIELITGLDRRAQNDGNTERIASHVL